MTSWPKYIPEHLATQFESGNAILFLGAGFSTAFENVQGQKVPLGSHLAKKIWSSCFPDEPQESNLELQYVFEVAKRQARSSLEECLRNELNINPDSVPGWVGRFLSLPWRKVYSLNCDNLVDVVNARFNLPRELVEVALDESGRNEGFAKRTKKSVLEYISLNGILGNGLDNLTFGRTQYSQRVSSPDPAYSVLVSELFSRSFVFMGSELDEPSLWAHIESRSRRPIFSGAEFRPKSYLVVPSLSRPKEMALSQHNIKLVPSTAAQFSDYLEAEVPEAAIEKGLSYLCSDLEGGQGQISEVGELLQGPIRPTQYLMGQEPTWDDIRAERAAIRECDHVAKAKLDAILKDSSNIGLLVITGTAGVGKSTVLKRLASTIAIEGKRVAWVDKYCDIAPHLIVDYVCSEESPNILFIDDARLYGGQLWNIVSQILASSKNNKVVLGIRSMDSYRLLKKSAQAKLELEEMFVPTLADSDIEGILDVLERENRLGRLKTLPRNAQVERFRAFSGRQLLVAMISATSGTPFQEKIFEEFESLSAEGERFVYSLAILATSFGFGLSRDSFAICNQEGADGNLAALDLLLRRHYLYKDNQSKIWARHRVIADELVKKLQRDGLLHQSIHSLAWLAAVKGGFPRKGAMNRMLKHVISHRFLTRMVEVPTAREIYQDLEQVLAEDYHFWLQRGSFELGNGNLDLAENFLSQARQLGPTSSFVETEWGYLLYKKAIAVVNTPQGEGLAEEARNILLALVESGEDSVHAFHILGTQGLVWLKSIRRSQDEERDFLHELRDLMQDGVRRYPGSQKVRSVCSSIEREYLLLAVPRKNRES